MRVLPDIGGLARRAAPARRTVRLRLTALYSTLFLVSGAGLLVITNLLARGWGRPVLEYSRRGTTGQIEVHAVGTRILHQLQRQSAAQHATSLNQLLTQSAIALGVMTVAATVLGWLMAGRVLHPLRAMITAARAISAHDLSQRLAVPGPDDELKDLSDTIDGLLDRLETAFTAQARFAASASHELRTPLAMMRTSVDVATGKPPPVSPQVMVLAGKLRNGLDQADQLVENLLLLARAQHGASEDPATIPLGPMLVAAIDDRADVIASMGLDVRHAADNAWVAGNPVLLARMTANLIDNAVRHNHPGGWFRAQITIDQFVVRLVVENGGRVLAQEKVSSLTEPFRRLGTDRTGSADGSGLGLTIVEAIATTHGGTLHLDARPDGGLRAVILLPATLRPLAPPATQPTLVEAAR